MTVCRWWMTEVTMLISSGLQSTPGLHTNEHIKVSDMLMNAVVAKSR